VSAAKVQKGPKATALAAAFGLTDEDHRELGRIGWVWLAIKNDAEARRAFMAAALRVLEDSAARQRDGKSPVAVALVAGIYNRAAGKRRRTRR